MTKSTFAPKGFAAMAALCLCISAHAQGAGALTMPAGSSLERLLDPAVIGVETGKINPVREAALRDTAMVLGAQAGFKDRSTLLLRVLKQREHELDNRFRFNELMLGDGFMPPVISEATDGVSLEATSMRVFSRMYSIDEPARPVAYPPNWRNWMYIGLDDSIAVNPPSSSNLLPQNDQERSFWEKTLKAAYKEGSRQAIAIYESNLARMERSYAGMKRFYDLYQRGMVTAPKIASSSEIVSREDPNTIVVGNVLWRIVEQANFNTNHQTWVPLDR